MIFCQSANGISWRVGEAADAGAVERPATAGRGRAAAPSTAARTESGSETSTRYARAVPPARRDLGGGLLHRVGHDVEARDRGALGREAGARSPARGPNPPPSRLPPVRRSVPWFSRSSPRPLPRHRPANLTHRQNEPSECDQRGTARRGVRATRRTVSASGPLGGMGPEACRRLIGDRAPKLSRPSVALPCPAVASVPPARNERSRTTQDMAQQELGSGDTRRKPIALGGALVTMVEPHRGHEVAYNRWYERDHFYAGCLIGAWTIAGARYVATADLKALRYPADSPVCPDPTSGSYVSIYWILAGKFGEWMKWGTDQVNWLHANDRMFEAPRPHPHRDVPLPRRVPRPRRRGAGRARARSPVAVPRARRRRAGRRRVARRRRRVVPAPGRSAPR